MTFFCKYKSSWYRVIYIKVSGAFKNYIFYIRACPQHRESLVNQKMQITYFISILTVNKHFVVEELNKNYIYLSPIENKQSNYKYRRKKNGKYISSI